MDTEGGTNKAGTGQTLTRSRRRRRVWWTIGAIVAVMILLVLLTPTLLSSGPATRFISSKVSDSIPGSVQVDDLSLGWFGGQRVRGLQIHDPAGDVVAVIDEVDMPDASLLQLLRGNLNLGGIHIRANHVDIVEHDDGSTNLARALGLQQVDADKPRRTAQQRQEQRADLSMHVTVTGGRITYTPHDGEPVEVTDFRLDLNAPTIERIEGELHATVKQGNQSGRVQAKGQIHDLFDAAGAPTPERATMQIDADLAKVPVLPLDRLLNLRGRLIAVTGDMEAGQIRMSGPLLNPDVMQMVARGDRFTMDVDLRGTDRSVRAEPDSVVRFTVTPEAWPVLMEDHATLAASRLLRPFEVTVELHNLELPREMGRLDIPEGSMAAQVTVTDIEIATDNERIGTLAVRNANMAIRSDAIGRAIEAVVQAIAEQDGRQGNVAVTATINNLLLPDQSLNVDGYSAVVNGQVKDLPMAVIDEVAAMRGVLVAMLGSTLQATLEATLEPVADGGGVAGPVRLTAQAEHISLQFSGTQQPDQFTLDQPATIAINVQPNVLDEVKQAFPNMADTLAQIRLTQPTRANVQLTHLRVPWRTGEDEAFDLSSVEFAATANVENVQLDGDSRFAGMRVDTLALRLPQTRLGDPIAFDADVRMRANGTPSAIQLNGSVAGLLDESVHIVLEGTADQMPVALVDAVLGRDGQLVTLLGDQLETVRMMVNSDAERPGTYAFDLTIDSPRLRAVVKGDYSPTLVRLADGSHLRIVVTPEAFTELQQRRDIPELVVDDVNGDAGEQHDSLRLNQPMTLALTVDRLQLGWLEPDESGERRLDAANSMLDIRLTSEGGGFISPTVNQSFDVRNLDVTVSAEDLREALAIAANAEVGMAHPGPDDAQPARGRIASETRIHGLVDAQGRFRSMSELAYETQTQIRSLPTAMVDALLRQDGLLPVLLGPQFDTIDLVIQAAGDDDRSMAIRAHVVSDRLNLPLSGNYIGGPAPQITLRGAGPATLQLTPEAFTTLRRTMHSADDGEQAPPDNITLAQATTFELQLQQLAIGLRNPQLVQADGDEPEGEQPPLYDPQRTGIIATLRAPDVRLLIQRTEGVDTLDVERMELDINVPALIQPGRLSLQAQTLVAPMGRGTPARGSVESRTTISNMVNAQGRLDLSQARFETNTVVEELPVAPLDAVLSMDNQLVAVLGQRASMSIVGNFSMADNGDQLDIVLNSENAKGGISATVGEFITLRKDIVGTLRVTPEVADTLLKYGNPLLIDATASSEPIRLTISHETFRLPLMLFRTDRERALREMALDAELQLGTLTLQDSWLLGALMPELQRLAQALNRRSGRLDAQQQAHFTNLRVTVRNGIARSNDLWMQVPQALVGVQGDVNLVTGYANLNIGVGSQTLRQFGSLNNYVPAGEVFPIAVRGPLSELRKSVDFSPLFIPVATAAAQQAIGNRDIPIGEILRGISRVTLPPGARRDWPNYPADAVLQSQRQDQQPQQRPDEQPPPAQQQQPRDREPQRERPGLGDLLDLLRDRDRQDQRR